MTNIVGGIYHICNDNVVYLLPEFEIFIAELSRCSRSESRKLSYLTSKCFFLFFFISCVYVQSVLTPGSNTRPIQIHFLSIKVSLKINIYIFQKLTWKYPRDTYYLPHLNVFTNFMQTLHWIVSISMQSILWLWCPLTCFYWSFLPYCIVFSSRWMDKVCVDQ